MHTTGFQYNRVFCCCWLIIDVYLFTRFCLLQILKSDVYVKIFGQTYGIISISDTGFDMCLIKINCFYLFIY